MCTWSCQILQVYLFSSPFGGEGVMVLFWFDLVFWLGFFFAFEAGLAGHLVLEIFSSSLKET